MLKAVFFDLDGTLLRFDENKFLKMYFQLLCEKTAKIGYEPKKLIDTIWKGTALMYHNNGEKTNEVVFWEAFQEEYGKEYDGDVLAESWELSCHPDGPSYINEWNICRKNTSGIY